MQRSLAEAHRSVEVLALRVLARAGVISSDNEMRGTKVLSDDCVPQSFSRSSHTHGKGKKGKVGHAFGVRRHERLIRPDTGVVVDVARFSETDDGVDQDIRPVLPSSANSEFSVGAVHRVSRLESDDFAPSEFVEICSQFGGGVYMLSAARITQRGRAYIGCRRSHSVWVLGSPGPCRRRRIPLSRCGDMTRMGAHYRLHP